MISCSKITYRKIVNLELTSFSNKFEYGMYKGVKTGEISVANAQRDRARYVG